MLEGRHALVTGGGTGIGLAIAQALAGAGALVTITGRRLPVLQDAAAGTPGLFPLAMDVADEASVEDGCRAATAARGPLTICVANAGIAEGAALHKTTFADWRRMMAINLDGAFLTIRACLPAMKEAGWGRILTVSSIAGLRGLKGAPTYSASKHGMIGLTRALSEDLMGSGITSNALCPGYTETEIITRNVDRISARAGISEDAAREIMVSANRHGRLVSPREVAAAALWLCGPDSGSLNGQAIEIAGGQV